MCALCWQSSVFTWCILKHESHSCKSRNLWVTSILQSYQNMHFTHGHSNACHEVKVMTCFIDLHKPNLCPQGKGSSLAKLGLPLYHMVQTVVALASEDAFTWVFGHKQCLNYLWKFDGQKAACIYLNTDALTPSDYADLLCIYLHCTVIAF